MERGGVDKKPGGHNTYKKEGQLLLAQAPNVLTGALVERALI